MDFERLRRKKGEALHKTSPKSDVEPFILAGLLFLFWFSASVFPSSYYYKYIDAWDIIPEEVNKEMETRGLKSLYKERVGSF
jgi:hypothetical protein